MTGPQIKTPDPAATMDAERIAKRLQRRAAVKALVIAAALTAVGLAAETLVTYALANPVGGWDLPLRGAFAIAVYSTLVAAGLRKRT